MKKSDELIIEKTQKCERMTAIVDKAEAEKREMTDEENTEFDNLNKEVRSLTKQIERAETFESVRSFAQAGRNRNKDNTKDDDDPTGHQRDNKTKFPAYNRNKTVYSVGKAMREWVSGGFTDSKLSGVEAEQHVELMKRNGSSSGLMVPFSERAQTTTTNADSIDVKIDPNISVFGSVPAWRELGMTVLPGLKGTFKLGKKTPDVAEKTDEGDDIETTDNVPSFITFAPERFGVTDLFTKELLVQENPAVQAAIISDMIAGCDRKLTTEAYEVALAAATSVTAATALTKTGLNAIAATVDGGGKFAMTRSTFFEGKDVAIDAGSGRFLLKSGLKDGVGNTADGDQVIYSSLFSDGDSAQYVLFAAWYEQYIGFWDGLEILMNPYTYQKSAQIEMTVNRLAKIAVRNSAAFAKSANLSA